MNVQKIEIIINRIDNGYTVYNGGRNSDSSPITSITMYCKTEEEVIEKVKQIMGSLSK